MRIAEWPRADGDDADPPPIGRRDAGGFAKAVLRFGRKDRIADVAKEVGGNFESASEVGRCKLKSVLTVECA